MGPCCYCKVMIYDEWIAERGYHRACHEKAVAKLEQIRLQRQHLEQYWTKMDRRAVKRRLRRAEIRREKKLGVK